MAFEISKDQKFYLAMALATHLHPAPGGSFVDKVHESMEKRGWLDYDYDRSVWVITDLGRTVARQLGLTSEYAKDGRP